MLKNPASLAPLTVGRRRPPAREAPMASPLHLVPRFRAPSAPWRRAAVGAGEEYRPRPGAQDERDFVARCLRCQECVRACLTGCLQPAGRDFGAGKALTPVVNVNHFWFSWAAFRPETVIYGAAE